MDLRDRDAASVPVHPGWLTLLNGFLKMYGYQVGPVILGMILGPLMDKSYRQAMISAEGNPAQFAMEFLTSPLSAIILAALLLTIASQTAWWRRWRGTA